MRPRSSSGFKAALQCLHQIDYWSLPGLLDASYLLPLLLLVDQVFDILAVRIVKYGGLEGCRHVADQTLG